MQLAAERDQLQKDLVASKKAQGEAEDGQKTAQQQVSALNLQVCLLRVLRVLLLSGPGARHGCGGCWGVLRVLGEAHGGAVWAARCLRPPAVLFQHCVHGMPAH